MEFPLDFRCPISMELMKDPVTVSTGITYDRKSIEKWFFTCKKKTCPTTMQKIENFNLTPNHTLKRLILAWQEAESRSHPSSSNSSPTSISIKHDELVSILDTIKSTPFKVSPLQKLRTIFTQETRNDEHVKNDFILCGGVEMLIEIIGDTFDGDMSDFVSFRAAEEALGVLDQLSLEGENEDAFRVLMSKPESMKSMAVMLQRGSVESRSHAIAIYRKVANANFDWQSIVTVDFFKSLLEIICDQMCCTTKTSSHALEVMIEILSTRAPRKLCLLAIEAGTVCALVELLPDTDKKSKCEKMLVVIKLLCECVEGRMSLVDHGLGIAIVSKKMLRVSNIANKTIVKILWLISSNSHGYDVKVVEEMLVYGSVKKMLTLLYTFGGRNSSATKDKVVSMFKLHGSSWQSCPCFSIELKQFLGFVNDSW